MENQFAYPHKELLRTPADLSKFFVITVVSNPVRYKRRNELYWRFKEMCESAGVQLITVEQAFGNRPFMVTNGGSRYQLQVRTVEELWHKENMINLGIRHACATFPGQVREVAWIDADCAPSCPPREWFEETWHQLQHYEFVQMWENLIDLDYSHNPIGPALPGFMANYIKYGSPNPKQLLEIESKSRRCHCHPRHHTHKHHRHRHHPKPPQHYPYGKIFGRPGLAWAANVDAFNKVGGLIDYCILGAGDWYMAHALVGTLETCTAEYAGGAYQKKMFQWQETALRWIKKDVGYVPGTVFHYFHGKKKNRFYGSRGKILHDCQYDPDKDVKYDSQGLLQLETWDERQIQLRDRIRAYFRSRNEDDISS